MGGMLLLAGYLACGLGVSDALLRRRTRLVRIWFGLCAGLMLMMWLPTLLAFALRFTALAQLLGLAASAALAGVLLWRVRDKSRCARWTDMPLAMVLALLVPFAVLAGWLQYSHILRPAADGLHVGQSTYGDLCLHLGIATGLRSASYPPDYTLLPGTLLGYPFLGDSMVTGMLLLGGDLRASFAVTGTLMMVLVYLGDLIFAWEVTHSPLATTLSFLLLFVNGGLGFIYPLHGIWKDSTAFRAIFTDFYATPTNQPALNLRWVNVICDMMVPQRTLLTGWMALMPALWLLIEAVREKDVRLFMLLGVWAGGIPMVHTHSFLALGIASAGAMAWTLIHARRSSRGTLLQGFLLYGGLAMLLSAPQLLTWSVPQTVKGGSMQLRFNWVNNRGDGTLIENYFWFWIKNVGPIWLLMIPAALLGRPSRKDPRRMLACGALLIYIVAELIQFQPNAYDNNKLFYVAFILMLPAVGMLLEAAWHRLRGFPGRGVLAALFLAVSLLSGGLTIGREVVSDYRLFSPEDVKAAAFIDANTPADAVFLTGSQHNNAVAALAGRHIVCGTSSYLYFHGVDYRIQQADEKRMLTNPAENAELFERYGISYAYISSYERYNFAVDEAWFQEHGELVFVDGDVCLYALDALGTSGGDQAVAQ